MKIYKDPKMKIIDYAINELKVINWKNKSQRNFEDISKYKLSFDK